MQPMSVFGSFKKQIGTYSVIPFSVSFEWLPPPPPLLSVVMVDRSGEQISEVLGRDKVGSAGISQRETLGQQ
jgi:hypothetical protein